MTSTSTRERGLVITNKLERAVLAGGCFWGMQDLIRKLPGVVKTRVGYTGGDVPNATYRNHGSHAEAIEIEFAPTRISYRDLLELFFQIHDPTTLNRQGNDVGTAYRSEIFYVSEAQRDEALRTIDYVNASGLWPGPRCDEGLARRRILGGRAGAPGLSRALPVWLYLPLPAPWLETAPARRCGHLRPHRKYCRLMVRTAIDGDEVVVTLVNRDYA
jgi:peptide-methionine (S)-S-oxide reductase